MDIEGVNRSLFLALIAPPGLAGISLNLAIGAAKYAIVLLAGIVMWRWLQGASHDRNLMTHVVLAVLPALAVNYVVGLVFFIRGPSCTHEI